MRLGSLTLFLLPVLLSCGSLIDNTARIEKRAAEASGNNKPVLSSNKSLTSFFFDQAVTSLSSTYNGTFTSNNISVRLPYGLGLTALKPSFTTTGVAVLVAGVNQTSGVTLTNFSSPVTYTVVAEDGTTQDYTVTIFQISSLQDSGQATCYGMGTVLGACNDVTYPNQDADFNMWPNARAVMGTTTNPSYPADFINRDPLNGIVWKTCSQGASGSTCLSGVPGSQTQVAGATACAGLNSAPGYAGIQTWRLPSAIELMQLQHFVSNGVYYDPAIFPNAPAFTHWSSTVLASTGNAVQIFGNFSTASTGTANRIRCVAGGTHPAGIWQDQGNGTILGQRTGLVWQKCGVGQTNDATCTGTVSALSWSQALQACKNLTLASRSWRLPNMMEAFSLLDFSANTGPLIHTASFPNFPPTGTPTPRMWTSTTLVSNTSYAYVIDYAAGTSGTIDAKSASLTGANLYYARCVSGPP